MAEFDVEAELSALKSRAAIRRRRQRPSKSRLDKYRGELLALHRRGATLAELQIWLRDRRIKVVESTIHRWLKKNAL